jgi:arginyl-tRNA synthetase
MDIYKHFTYVVQDALRELVDAGKLPAGLDLSRISVEAPRDPSHGDIANNAPMVLAKSAGIRPREFAELLVDKLKNDQDTFTCEIAGPGFVNQRLVPAFWHERL